MKQNEKPRRTFVKNAIAGMGLLSTMVYGAPSTQATKKKIVCVGGHPDDPESGCGGTLAKLELPSK